METLKFIHQLETKVQIEAKNKRLQAKLATAHFLNFDNNSKCKKFFQLTVFSFLEDIANISKRQSLNHLLIKKFWERLCINRSFFNGLEDLKCSVLH